MDDLPPNLPRLFLSRQRGYEIPGNQVSRHELFLRPVDPNLEVLEVPRSRRSVSPVRRQLSPVRHLPSSLPPLRIRSPSPVRQLSPRRAHSPHRAHSPIRRSRSPRRAHSPHRAHSPIRRSRSPRRAHSPHRAHSPIRRSHQSPLRRLSFMDVDSPRPHPHHQQPHPNHHMDVDRYYGKKLKK